MFHVKQWSALLTYSDRRSSGLGGGFQDIREMPTYPRQLPMSRADVVYRITKTFWEHIDEVHRKSVGFKDLTLANAFRGTASPIHPGAVQYYREIGIEVPERLLHN